LLLSAKPGSGEGVITTDNTTEGSALDFSGLGNQMMDAMTPAPQDNPTTMSGTGLAALQKREGFSATPYADHKGYSIGYGHLIKAGENLTSVSVQQALDILAADVQWAQDAVASAITVPLTQAQFDALVSFCFNVGEGAFKRSTLVARINAGDPAASAEFGRWVYASGTVNQSLVARRQSEQNQFESATA
ncbi:MAG: lysozyme, partial [Rhodoferax sp.]